MRNLLTILLLVVSFGVFAQKPDSVSLTRAVHAFNKALINKDTVELDRLLRGDVHYYHSNGWMQSKREIIEDLFAKDSLPSEIFQRAVITSNKMERECYCFHLRRH